jgi:hypothetical protein
MKELFRKMLDYIKSLYQDTKVPKHIRTTLPITFVVENDSYEEKTVELFNGYEVVPKLGVNSDYIFDGITISSKSNIISYKQILFDTLINKYTIAHSYISVYDGKYEQLKNFELEFINKAVTGIFRCERVQSGINPYQFQKSVVELKKEFTIDGFFTIKFKILPQSKFKFVLFPKQ